MLDISEEITPLSFDQFHEMTSLKPHVLICDKITDENSAKTFCARMPGDEFPKMFDLRKFTGKLSADFDKNTERILSASCCCITKNNLDGKEVET